MIYLTKNLEVLTKNCMYAEKWWIWIGVQNGLGVFATWVNALTATHFAIMLQRSGVNAVTAGAVALVLLFVWFVLWSIFELTFFDRYSRYLFMPYVTIAWAYLGFLIGGSLLAGSGVFVFTWVAFSILVILGIVKLVVMLVKHFVDPLK